MTDMLPFEVPPTFSNRGFYSFLKKYDVAIDDKFLSWTADTDGLDLIIKILFGIKDTTKISTEEILEWGKRRKRRCIPIKFCRMDTIPFNFNVSHKVEGRTLSIVHPRNQVQVAGFYANHSGSILYYTSLSDFSIRRPVSVSKYAFYRDKLHEQRLEASSGGIETESHEYEQLGSYFVYRKYRNIHRFFESYEYHRAEKKYDAMVQVDVSKCFDSIYTHSLPWATLGKNQTKAFLKESETTFAGRFDSIMQKLNYKETNGIVIGPEFSRIFAEIILQSIDVELRERLAAEYELIHKVDYDIFRYVDDFFIFYNSPDTQQKILDCLQVALRAKKLSINAAKVNPYQKPIITEITIAKERISTSLNAEIAPACEELPGPGDTVIKRLSCPVNSNHLIIRYKTILKQAGIGYTDIINFTFAIVENKIEKLLKTYLKSDQTFQDKKRLIVALLSIMEFVFFVYSASPKVNHTVRVCRMITTSADFLTSHAFPYDLKHSLFKYVHDNIMQQLDKNLMTPHREVESLYLLISLSRIGKEYWLPVGTITKHMLIKWNPKDNTFRRDRFLSHFSITVLLSYLKKKVRYDDLRKFLEGHILSKAQHSKAHCHNDAESLMLFLDILVCPYVSDETKKELAHIFDVDSTMLPDMQSVNDCWFTAWGDKFDLAKELDAKRSREVY